MNNHLLIAGGGMVGPVMALTMAKNFAKITILEKRSRELNAKNGQSSLQIILSERGWRTLEDIGLKKEVIKLCIPLAGRIQHHKEQLPIKELYGENEETISCVSRDKLHRVLLSKIKEAPNINLIYNCEATDVDLENRKLTCITASKKTELDYDLLIGADGANSAIAQKLNNQSDRICAIEDYAYKETSIWNDKLSPNCFHYYNCSNYMAGAFPSDMNGNFSLFYIYSNKNEKNIFDPENIFKKNNHNPLIPQNSLKETINKLMSVQSGILGNVTNEVWHYKKTVLLIGDAAHTILPFMGQGLNLGLEDVYLFSRFWGNNPKSFEPFCELRKKDTNSMGQISTDQFKYLLGQTNPNTAAIMKEKNDYYKKTGQRNLYSACAFTLKSIYEIYMNDKKTEAQLKNK